jgi:hypothetical protein
MIAQMLYLYDGYRSTKIGDNLNSSCAVSSGHPALQVAENSKLNAEAFFNPCISSRDLPPIFS